MPVLQAEASGDDFSGRHQAVLLRGIPTPPTVFPIIGSLYRHGKAILVKKVRSFCFILSCFFRKKTLFVIMLKTLNLPLSAK